MRARTGASLVEAVVALVVLAAGLLSVASLAARSLRLVDEADAIARADGIAVAVLDSLLQHENPMPGSIAGPGTSIDWSVNAAGAGRRVELRVRYACSMHAHADTFTAIAAAWPRRLIHVP